MAINTQKNYAIDAARIRGLRDDDRDPDATDAIWIPVISPDRDECESPEAQADAIRYVTRLNQGVATGIDRQHGPQIDSGRIESPQYEEGGPVNQGVTSAEDYLRSAAVQKLSADKGGAIRFVTFFRVRRADNM